jgi:ribonuclease R
MSDFTNRVLKLVAQPEYRPITLKAMSRALHVEPEKYAEFRSTIKQLVKEGRLDQSKDKTLRRPGLAGTIIGVFRRSAKGFGFVRPHRAGTASEDQIFIPAKASRDAATGDEVAVKITERRKAPGMNAEGRVVQVLARASGVFVGTYFEEEGEGRVLVDGNTFHDPIAVGDPGAKGARPGDKVVLEVVRYPSPFLEGEGVVTEVLGARGQPGVDTLSVLRAFNIPDIFDDDALAEAREQARQFDENQIGDRLDLRDVLTVTIDPAQARDFDDAISLERDERGFWSLGVHIADVAHFVRAGSALDQTARTRGTSVYLPDKVVPMLPEVLSNSLASLQAGRTRYTLSVLMEFDPSGILTDRRFARSAIRVDQRFTYEQTYEIMMNPEPAGDSTKRSTSRLLVEMLELARILRRRRLERGAIELILPEVEIDLGPEGEATGAHLVPHDESHQVIEEFMLAANEAVASYLTEQRVPFLRRVHPDPEPNKLDAFAEFVRSLGSTLEQPQSRFELQRVLAEAAGQPEAEAVHYGLLRSMKQARYTPEPEGHYALASDPYCHFTSPIRRYPDLQVHRQLTALLRGKKPRGDLDELMILGDHCTRTERRAEAAERDLIRIKLLTYLEPRVGEVFHSVIIAVEEFGIFVRLVELPVEGLVHISSLSDDYYYREPETHTLIGRRSNRRYRLGDRLQVRIVRVDVDRRELDLVPADSPQEDRRSRREAGASAPRRSSPPKAAPTTPRRNPSKQKRSRKS